MSTLEDLGTRGLAAPVFPSALHPPMPRGGADRHPLDAVLAGSGLTLRQLAGLVLESDRAGEADCAAVAAAGAMLREAADSGRASLPAHLDTALVAWAAEQLAARRIDDGDLGIDAAARRLAEAEAQLASGCDEARRIWQSAQDDHTRLAETLLIDTFDELREFDLCKLFVADRAAYRARRDLGRRWLAEWAGRLVPTAH